MLSLAILPSCRAALQFDVFLGFDGVVREGGWFPVSCEIFNDGPSFNGVFELSPAQLGGGQARRMSIELPTGTRKRFTVPAFAAVSRYASWDARLYDERGKIRGERLAIRPKDLTWEGTLLGALPRAFGGAPVFPEIKQEGRPELKPQVARMQAEVFPDNPIALEGLSALYINTEKALELKTPQYNAILAWLHAGGHLIVGVEQPGDLGGLGWLRPVLPLDPSNVRNIAINGSLLTWLTNAPPESRNALRGTRSVPTPRPGRNQPAADVPGANPYLSLLPDPTFDSADLTVVTGPVRDGQVMASLGEIPVIVAGKRGRGQVTVLCFSPEREPFRSWKHRPWFWARLAKVPTALYMSSDFNLYGGWSVDGVFGAMIDSRQVRKLPVEWLIALLVVYLLVIGPLDQWWLKKINRQMLTWITFPAYVVLFSLLIYFIGYKLRAGETEWNELHIVDVIRNGDRAELRGRSYLSMYSPVNASYKLGSEQRIATFRGEFHSLWTGGQDGARTRIDQRPAGFSAEVNVPVWTSQLYVSDWWQTEAMPAVVSVVTKGTGFAVSVENRLDRPLRSLRLILRGRVYDIPDVAAGTTATADLDITKSIALIEFVTQRAANYQSVVQQRQQALGDANRGRLEADGSNATAVTFLSELSQSNPNQRQFVYPAGMDLGVNVDRGDAVVLAWVPEHAPSKSVKQFATVRSQRQSLYRFVVHVDPLPKL